MMWEVWVTKHSHVPVSMPWPMAAMLMVLSIILRRPWGGMRRPKTPTPLLQGKAWSSQKLRSLPAAFSYKSLRRAPSLQSHLATWALMTVQHLPLLLSPHLLSPQSSASPNLSEAAGQKILSCLVLLSLHSSHICFCITLKYSKLAVFTSSCFAHIPVPGLIATPIMLNHAV